MQMLYDSDAFVVVHMLPGSVDAPAAGGEGAPRLMRHGFEIVDKRSGKEVYLDGSWAELFEQRLAAWRQHSPTREEVETTLASYAELAQNPVVMH